MCCILQFDLQLWLAKLDHNKSSHQYNTAGLITVLCYLSESHQSRHLHQQNRARICTYHTVLLEYKETLHAVTHINWYEWLVRTTHLAPLVLECFNMLNPFVIRWALSFIFCYERSWQNHICRVETISVMGCLEGLHMWVNCHPRTWPAAEVHGATATFIQL